jgi:hypothetical protein
MTTSVADAVPRVPRRWLRRRLVRCLLAVSCVGMLLFAGLAWWWTSRPDFGDEVRLAGGRYRSEVMTTPTAAFFGYLSGRQPTVFHWIEFKGGDVDDEWLRAHHDEIAQTTDLVLTLRETRVTGEGLSTLRGLQNVMYLDLTGTPLTDADVAHLAALPNVVQVYIGRSGISGSGLAGLWQMHNLIHVGIDSTQATPEGVAGLADCSGLNSLTLLDAGDESVAQVARLNRLKYLVLEGEQVTGDSLPVLKQMQNLKVLTFYSADLSREEVDELQMALPGCAVQRMSSEEFERLWESQREEAE